MGNKDLTSWGTAAVVAMCVAATVTAFAFQVGKYTSPVDGNCTCAVAKVRAAWSLNRGSRVLVETPKGKMIQRVFALPGDTVEIVDGSLLVNGKRDKESRRALATYHLLTHTPYSIRRQMKEKGEMLDSTTFRLKVKEREEDVAWRYYTYTTPLPNEDDSRAYPWNVAFQWNAYHWGPMRLPCRGDVIRLNYWNMRLYGPLINTAEGHQVSESGEATYTFEHDYYFLLLPDRDMMDDSRAFGPVKDEAIIGRAILLGTD